MKRSGGLMLINSFDNSISGVTVAYTGSIGSLCLDVIDEKRKISNLLMKNHKIFSSQYINKMLKMMTMQKEPYI